MGLTLREPWLALGFLLCGVLGVVLGHARRRADRRGDHASRPAVSDGAEPEHAPAPAGPDRSTPDPAGAVIGGEERPPVSGPRPARTLGAIGATVGVAIGVTVIAAAVVPVRATAVADAAPNIVEDPGPPPSVVQPPARLDVTVTAFGDRPVRVVLPPSLVAARDTGLPGFRADGWQIDQQDHRVMSSPAAGGDLSFTGTYGHVDLELIEEPNAGDVRVQVADSEEVTVALDSPGFGLRTIRIASGRTRVEAGTSFGWRGHELRFQVPVERVESAAIGGLPTGSEPVFDAGGRLTGARVSAWDATSAIARGYADFVGVALVTALAGLASVAIGAAVEPRGFRWTRRPRWLMRAVVGLATACALIGALNYVLPVRVAMIVLPPLVGLGAFRLASRSGVHEPDSAGSRTMAVPAIATTTAVLTAASFTYVISGRWAIGHLQTDVFDTFNLTTLFWDRAALEASTDFGNGFRLLDYSARASIWGPFLLRPSDAVIVFRLLLLGLLTPLATTLAGRLRANAAVQVAVGVLTAAGGALVSLYSEGYMSREFFVLWMLIGLVVVSHQLLDGRRDRGSWFLLGIVLTVPLAVVPPYFVLAPALIGAFAVAIAGRGWRARAQSWRHALAGLGLAFLVGLPNLFWVRRASDAERYVPALNALVRARGVPFLGALRFPATLIGLVPFHNQSQYWLGGAAYQIGPLRWSTEWLGHPVFVIASLVIAGLLIAAAFRSLWRARSGALRNMGAFVFLVLVTYLLGLFVLRLLKWEDQTYFTVMWAWSLAPVAVTCFALLVTVESRRRGVMRIVGTIAVVSLALVNVVAAAGEAILWTEGARGSRAPLWHFDMAAPADRLSDAIEAGDLRMPTDEFAVVVAGPSALTGTDDDRVLANVLANLMEASGLRCEPCARNPDVPILQPASSAPPGTSVLLIGDHLCRGRPPVLEDEFFAICGPES